MTRRTLSLAALLLLPSCGSDEIASSSGDAGEEAGDAALDVLHFDLDTSMPSPVPCPKDPPAEGASCDVPSSEACEYGGSASPQCNAVYGCIGGAWKLVRSGQSCMPPDPCTGDVMDGGCGSIEEVCSVPDSGLVCVCTACGAGAPRPQGPVGNWACFAPGTGCPTTRPMNGTPCTIADGGACRYSPGGCCTGWIESCDQGVWVGYETAPCP